jgi:hypothetical protein
MSVGESRGRRRLVGATIAPAGGPPQVGALARSYIFGGAAAIDAYDSDLGDYGPSTLVSDTELLATNESSGLPYLAVLPISVQGKIFVGPGGDPVSQVGPMITHQGAETLAAPIDIPDITLPTGLAKYGNKTVLFGTQTLPPGEYKNVTVGGLGRLKLQNGGRYIFENLHVLIGSKLEVSGSDVEVYIDRRFLNLFANTIVNTTKKSKNLTFFCTGDSTTALDCGLAGGALGYYSLIAPKRDVTVVFGANLYGSVMTEKAITVAGTASLHYDVALRDSSPAGGFAIVSRHRL